MNISNNGFITINRGDSFSAPLFINCGTQLMPIRYSLKDHPRTEVYLGVMEPIKHLRTQSYVKNMI